MITFFSVLLIGIFLLIIIRFPRILVLLLSFSIFYVSYKAGILKISDIVGGLAGFAVVIGFIIYLDNAKKKREEKKKLEDQMQRLANLSHYIPKDDYPEFYEKNKNHYDKDI